MILLLYVRHIILVLTSFVLLTIYITSTIHTTIPQLYSFTNNNLQTPPQSTKNIQQNIFTFKIKSSPPVKNIIAYSLKKQIEIEGEEILCEKYDNSNKKVEFIVTDNNDINARRTKSVKSDSDINFIKKNKTTKVDVKTTTSVLANKAKKQWTKIENTPLQIYSSSAYLDKRLSPYKYLRIIAMVSGKWNETIYCQLEGDDGEMRTVKSKRTEIWSEQWFGNEELFENPILLSCQIPQDFNQTKRVYLSTKPCQINSANTMQQSSIKITNERTNSNEEILQQDIKITVCVKPLNFDLNQDISEKLLEWIELIKILGANKIDIYVKNIHRNAERLLNFYASLKDNIVKIIPHTDISPASIINEEEVEEEDDSVIIKKVWQKRKYELVAYNDCFYRHLEDSTYIVPLDIDEIIVPRRHKTWQEMLAQIPKKYLNNFASFSTRNAYFPITITTKNSDFFDNFIRGEFSPKYESGKSFISTKNTLTVFNHYALEALKPGLTRTYFLPTELVQMNHYKKHCSKLLPAECKRMLNATKYYDTILLKYRKEFKNALRKFNNKFTLHKFV